MEDNKYESAENYVMAELKDAHESIESLIHQRAFNLEQIIALEKANKDLYDEKARLEDSIATIKEILKPEIVNDESGNYIRSEGHLFMYEPTDHDMYERLKTIFELEENEATDIEIPLDGATTEPTTEVTEDAE